MGYRQILSQHQCVEIPPNIPHQILNESDRDLEFLAISQPTSNGDRILVS